MTKTDEQLIERAWKLYQRTPGPDVAHPAEMHIEHMGIDKYVVLRDRFRAPVDVWQIVSKCRTLRLRRIKINS
jgi:hypothetical protein